MSTTEPRTFSEGNIVTGMCLWEAFLDLASYDTDGDDDDGAEVDPESDDSVDEDESEDADESEVGDNTEESLRETANDLIGNEGSFTIRNALIDLIEPCEKGWAGFLEQNPDTDDQFDWEWCPKFIRAAMRDGTLDAAIGRQYNAG